MDGTGVTYSVRANAFEYDATWRLGPDAIEMTGGNAGAADATFTFPYRDIAELRLSFAASRWDSSRYRCDVRMRSGARTAILSTHYAGLGDFENRGSTYAPFVRALIARVAATNPKCTFRAGNSVVGYWAMHLFLAASLLALAAVIITLGTSSWSDATWDKLWVVIGAIPLVIALARANWPRTFKPDDIPKEVMPEV